MVTKDKVVWGVWTRQYFTLVKTHTTRQREGGRRPERTSIIRSGTQNPVGRLRRGFGFVVVVARLLT